MPTLPAGQHENTNALCSDGIDNDCNGYTDCNDYYCSRYTASVTVCNGTTPTDAGTPLPVDSGTTPPVIDAGPPGAVGQRVEPWSLLHFGVFGDAWPPNENDDEQLSNLYDPIDHAGDAEPQRAVRRGEGDYMFASDTTDVNTQLNGSTDR